MKKIVFILSSSLLVLFVVIAILNFSNSDKFYLSDLLSYLNTFPQNAYVLFINIFKDIGNKIISVPNFSQPFFDVVLEFFKYIFNLLLIPIELVVGLVGWLWTILEFFVNLITLIIG